ncbi:hypothetical protein yberc0001_27340 [Yersinia bercovieri ATCC 43970]|uniref:Uncharacterized protein n=1 Tax=Yersinia bercovieri ATCC 43970 TaxID=349968 RepID=A0ABM9XZL2_YERBE|nr:hypothetical protein yberc0001_27340 [Yersinia bercovieri ATCC 43970]
MRIAIANTLINKTINNIGAGIYDNLSHHGKEYVYKTSCTMS